MEPFEQDLLEDFDQNYIEDDVNVLETPRASRDSSSSSQFWEEFKKVNRNYSETDEAVICKQNSSTRDFCDQLFCYVASVIGICVGKQKTMSRKCIKSNYLVVFNVKSIYRSPIVSTFFNGV